MARGSTSSARPRTQPRWSTRTTVSDRFAKVAGLYSWRRDWFGWLDIAQRSCWRCIADCTQLLCGHGDLMLSCVCVSGVLPHVRQATLPTRGRRSLGTTPTVWPTAACTTSMVSVRSWWRTWLALPRIRCKLGGCKTRKGGGRHRHIRKAKCKIYFNWWTHRLHEAGTHPHRRGSRNSTPKDTAGALPR